MINHTIGGKTIKEWKAAHPVLDEIMKAEESIWVNPNYRSFADVTGAIELIREDIYEASDRLQRFQSYIQKAFPETVAQEGLIESPLRRLDRMQTHLSKKYQANLPGELFLKCDQALAISGSIKARGGIYEVLKHAESIAFESGLLTQENDYSVLVEPRFRELFSAHGIAVGSTGNLGLSIGIMSAKLGFHVDVHMSSDAKTWKKELLTEAGANVIEYEGDYSAAVKKGRETAAADPKLHFVDDENSRDLFLGYAVSALRLKEQLHEQQVRVDQEHPLFVYLPCGVGGGPGGVAFGLKQVFGDHVHCFFAEPTESPAMFVGLLTELHDNVSVHDFGLNNVTAADGLAVGRPSGFVGKTLASSISGVYTVADDHLYKLLGELWDHENIYLEPSALAGFSGPYQIVGTEKGRKYCEQNLIEAKQMENATHIVWGTGGSMVPEAVKREDYRYAQTLL